MRGAAFNSRAINSEPFNGQGIYPALKTAAAIWIVAQTVQTKTLSVSYNMFAGALAALSATWSIFARTPNAQLSTTFDVRGFVAALIETSWHSASGIMRRASLRWNVTFSARQVTGLTRSASTGAIVRHATTSSIET